MSEQAVLLLRKQLKEVTRCPVEGFSAGLADDSNVFEWNVSIMGPPDTQYEGGFFNALMTFPQDYPNNPPTVETIMLSIISMLSSPNDESPANIDAAKEWREDKEEYRRKVARCVRKSQENL
eukprot:gene23662-28673_t